MERIDVIDRPESTVNRNYAGFWIRFGAYVIDAVILIVAGIITELLVGNPETEILNSLLSLIIGILYESLFISSSMQATPGKMAVGIIVTTETGQRLSFANALGRYFAKILSAIILLIGFFMIAWDERKQGLHDKLANTFVVHK